MWVLWLLALPSSPCFLEFDDFIVHELTRASLDVPVAFNYNFSAVAQILAFCEKTASPVWITSRDSSRLSILKLRKPSVLSPPLYSHLFPLWLPWTHSLCLVSPLLLLLSSHAAFPILHLYWIFYFFEGSFKIVLMWKELNLLLRIGILTCLMLCKERKK